VRKNPISARDALKLAKKSSKVFGVMGKKVISYDIKKDTPTDEEILKIIIGRSGTLRAPCLQVNDIFVGGFDVVLYKNILKLK